MARTLPSAAKAGDVPPCATPSKLARSCPVTTSQSFTVESSPAVVATVRVSGEDTRNLIPPP
jgi:hypothetical protein